MFVATKCTTVDLAEEWSAWYTDDYLPALVGGAVVAATRWCLGGTPAPGGPGPGHSHVSRLDVEGDPAEAARAVRRGVAEMRRGGRIHPAHAETAVDVWAAQGATAPVIDAASPRTAMIVAEVMCTDPAREPEWDAWYDDQHVPDMLSSGAFAAATRWVRVPRRGAGCDHLTVYEVTGFDAAEAVRRSAAAMPGIIAAGRKHECHTGGKTMALDAE